MKDLPTIAQRVDQEIIRSRLNNLNIMMMTDRSERLVKIAAVLDTLPRGAYLIGTGPSTVGIIPVSVEELVLGRAATPLETPSKGITDYDVCDTMYLTPYEVSRLHAKIRRVRDGSEWSVTIFDLGSKCGTFVNGDRIDAEKDGRRLAHGDVIALGASHTSTYLFVEAEDRT